MDKDTKNNYALVFDLYGDYGCFRTKDTSKRTLTHIFSRTSLIGIIGSILGIEKNTYWKSDDDLKNINIALSCRNPIKTYMITVNHAQTKDNVMVKLKNKGKKQFNTYIFNNIKSEKEKESTDVSIELLENLRYRIFVSNDNKYYDELKHSLENNLSVYPIYFGHIEYLANIDYIGEYEMERISKTEIKTDTIVSERFINKIKNDCEVSYHMDIGVPISMKYDGKEIIEVESDNFLIVDNGNKLHFIINENYINNVYKINNETVVFLPKSIKKGE